MSALTDLIYAGSNAVAGLTEGAVNDAIAKRGADTPVAFPDTAYFFPTIYAATGVKVKTLGDLPACVDVLKSLITNQDDIAQALNAGLATAVGAEIIEGLKYLGGADPYAEDSGIGFVPDPIIRSLGVPLVTGDIPGVAVVLGKADDAEDVAKVVKDYQSKGILTFMIGDCIEQALAQGVKMGLELRVVPLGHDVTSVIHVVTVAIRAALIFGNVQPGDLAGLLKYTKERVPAFVNTFGPLNEVVVSAGAGAIALGFPVVVDQDIGDLQIPGALEYEGNYSETVKRSLALRNIHIKVKELPIPVAFAAAFEGEIIRKADMQVEFWSAKNTTCELVTMRESGQIEDHKITLKGPDIDSGEVEYPIATYIEGGRRQDAEGLRVRHRAEDPRLVQLPGGRDAHRPAQPDPHPHQQRRLRQGPADAPLRRGPLLHDHGRVLRGGGQVPDHPDHRRGRGQAHPGRGGHAHLQRQGRPAGLPHRRERGPLLHLHPLPVLRPQPRVRG